MERTKGLEPLLHSLEGWRLTLSKPAYFGCEDWNRTSVLWGMNPARYLAAPLRGII